MIKRIGISLITLVLAMLLTFILLRMTPGSFVDDWARQYSIQYNIPLTDAYERVARMINYNPNEPVHEQLLRYIKGLASGNLGVSMLNQNLTVNQVVAEALPWTVFLLTVSMIISFVIGTKLGTIMAWKRKSIWDPVISIYTIISTAIPGFLIGLILLVVFAFQLNWFPVNGAYGPLVTPGFNMEYIVDVLYHATLPIATYIIITLGGWALAMKGSAISVLGEDYITAAWARGIQDKKIMNNYVKKNAMLPLITSLAVTFGTLLGGSPLIEQIFNYQGLGYFMVQATTQRDYTMMQGLLLISAVAMILANLIADIVYTKLDPRVKFEE